MYLLTLLLVFMLSEYRNPILIWNVYVLLRESGLTDYIGAFAVTSGFGTDKLCQK